MYKIRRPIKDSTIYLYAPNQNAGLDPIIEVGKYYDDNDDLRMNRGLIQFDLNGLSNIQSADMVLWADELNEIPLSYTLYAYPISGSWEMGIGTYSDGVTTDGVTWNTRDGNTNWTTGSEWYETPFSTQSFEYQTADVQMNVLSIVQNWLSGSLDNNGVIIKYSTANEEDTLDYGNLQFFSKETHTIYQPMLRVGVDDVVYSTGSRSNFNSTPNIKVIPRIQSEYSVDTTVKVPIVARELYPSRVYDRFVYQNDLPLPKEAYYQITDYSTGTILIPYGEYSKISFDTTVGSYITLDLTDWIADRTYEIKFKVTRNGFDEYFSDKYLFKITR